MKNYFILTFVSAVLLITSCKKNKSADEPQQVFATTAETKPQYDNTSFGVYKGVIIGSSGTIVFRINNGDNIVKGYLSFDGMKDTLSTTATLVAGQPLVNVLFTGKFSSMRISANANGSNAQLTNIQITGHNNVTGFIIHEISNRQVLCYEGTFSGTASGIINATRVGLKDNDTTFLLMKVQSVNDTILYRGYNWTLKDTAKVNIYSPGGGTQMFRVIGIYNTGTFNPNTFNGTWTGNYGSGAFTAKRTY